MDALSTLLDRGARINAKDNVSDKMWMKVSKWLYSIWWNDYADMITMKISVDELWSFSLATEVMMKIFF